MSNELEQAKELVAAGNDKKALKHLWTVEATARSSKKEAEALLELVVGIHARSGGRVQRDAEALLELARTHVTRFSVDPTADALVRVPRCRVLASTGFTAQRDEIWALVFTEEAMFLRSLDRSVNALERIEYAALTEIAVGQPPVYRTAGRKTGEAALKVGAYMLTQMSPVGGLPSTGSNEIGITLRTSSGELVLLHVSELTIDQWQERLAPMAAIGRPPGE
jgi:hypothetical protein